MPAPTISVRGVGKSFEGNAALADVDLDVRPGTIHALVGENGAGKSTLGKILAGVHQADTGVVRLDGNSVDPASPREALALGITIVAQEIALVGTRSVIENVFLGSEVTTGPFVRTAALRRRFEALVAETGIDVDGDATVDQLTIADQQKVEILRALARRADVIVMDEPTARLATHEAEALMRIFDGLRRAGTTIVFVSHFLEEVLGISDQVTVLRDGRVVADGAASSFTPASLIAAMVGRTLDAAFPPKRIVPEARTAADEAPAPALKVTGLTRSGVFEDVGFEVRPGEIVVITGLVGSGRTEVLRAIYGLDTPTAGTVEVDGKVSRTGSPRASIAEGVALIPESRKTEGLFLDFPLVANVSLPHLRRFTRAGLVRAKQVARVAAGAMEDVGVKTPSPEAPASLLSGGNQQKVLFARALLGKPRLLIADEPTRGVDVAAKRQIYDLIAAEAARGSAVLLVSSEMEEVIGLAHRVIVMRQGRVLGELAGDDINESSIAHLAFGQTTKGHHYVD
ncbi:sugar ABC transporter ATP-binding protein [Pimelobacter simplex]|uniref:sugar ABC transporter ATP-binding protein n=1 Tax=Nocardioides simplex TaxID=2045 RepID=UPI003AADFE51